MKTIIALCFASALLAGCTRVYPGMQLADVRSTALSATATELAASMIIRNPTQSPLLIAGATYRLYLDGTYIGEGSTDDPVEVPPQDDAPQTVTLRIEDPAALPLLNRLLAGEALPYRVEAILQQGSGRVAVEFEGRLGAPA